MPESGMAPLHPALPVTEILYLEIDPGNNLQSSGAWGKVLELCEDSEGFIEHYWGRGIDNEFPERVRLHVVRSTLENHKAFHASPPGQSFQRAIGGLTSVKPVIRHVLLEEFCASKDGCLARQAPVTGSALYLNSTEDFHLYAWPLWTRIVRRASGNKGVAGGKVIDHESGKDAYLVYVGWDTTDSHQAFRKSPACADRRVILTLGNSGHIDHHHIIFEK